MRIDEILSRLESFERKMRKPLIAAAAADAIRNSPDADR